MAGPRGNASRMSQRGEGQDMHAVLAELAGAAGSKTRGGDGGACMGARLLPARLGRGARGGVYRVYRRG